MPLRRLTKMSKIELETAAAGAEKHNRRANQVAQERGDAIKAQVSDELTAVGKSYATPRRTRIGAALTSPDRVRCDFLSRARVTCRCSPSC
jgi:DNA gyrase/topoisomerase IV subunit A